MIQDDFHTNVMGGIASAAISPGRKDEDLAMIGLAAMNV